ncbi:MAG: protein rep [Eubacteriaceae bacterium]|nr:protein rep [Eubacteriaceae bacterium]
MKTESSLDSKAIESLLDTLIALNPAEYEKLTEEGRKVEALSTLLNIEHKKASPSKNVVAASEFLGTIASIEIMQAQREHALDGITIKEPRGALSEMATRRQRADRLADIYMGVHAAVKSGIYPEPVPAKSGRKRASYKSKAERVGDCATYLVFAQTLTEQKMVHANHCRDRLCPICMEGRSSKIYGQAIEAAKKVVQRDRALSLIAITLTERTCRGWEVRSEMDEQSKAWNRFASNPSSKAIMKGWFKGIEVTYDPVTDMYHPHMHIVAIVGPEYFKRGGPPRKGESKKGYKKGRMKKGGYRTTEEWAAAWGKSRGLDYEPIVHVQKVGGDSESREAALAEVSKYSVKAEDYIFEEGRQKSNREKAAKRKGEDFDSECFGCEGRCSAECCEEHGQMWLSEAEAYDLSVEVAYTLTEALRGKRLYAFGGLLKEAVKEAKEERKESCKDYKEQITDSDGTVLIRDIDYILFSYRWEPELQKYAFCQLMTEKECRIEDGQGGYIENRGPPERPPPVQLSFWDIGLSYECSDT